MGEDVTESELSEVDLTQSVVLLFFTVIKFLEMTKRIFEKVVRDCLTVEAKGTTHQNKKEKAKVNRNIKASVLSISLIHLFLLIYFIPLIFHTLRNYACHAHSFSQSKNAPQVYTLLYYNFDTLLF